MDKRVLVLLPRPGETEGSSDIKENGERLRLPTHTSGSLLNPVLATPNAHTLSAISLRVREA